MLLCEAYALVAEEHFSLDSLLISEGPKKHHIFNVSPPGYTPNTWLLTPYTVSTELGKTKQNKVFSYKQLLPFQNPPPRSLCFKKERER